jgi:hypothetical protein
VFGDKGLVVEFGLGRWTTLPSWIFPVFLKIKIKAFTGNTNDITTLKQCVNRFILLLTSGISKRSHNLDLYSFPMQFLPLIQKNYTVKLELGTTRSHVMQSSSNSNDLTLGLFSIPDRIRIFSDKGRNGYGNVEFVRVWIRILSFA